MSTDRFSFWRISFFIGKMYVLCLSGNIEVFQLVLPILAITGTDPKPLGLKSKLFFSSLLISSFIVAKCQGLSPLWIQTDDLKK